MKEQTPMQELVPALRQWVKQWDLYETDPLDYKKPQNIDDFIAPYLEKEKQSIIDAHLAGQNSNEEIDGETEIDYFNNKYNTK